MASLRVVVLAVCSCSTWAYVMPAAPLVARSGRAAAARMEEGVEKSIPMMPNQHTWMPKTADMAMSAKQWYVVDAAGLRLGRMSSEIAKILLGKNKPEYTPGAMMGDCVVVINADKVIVTGKKRADKLYRRHSGRPGGMTIESFDELQIRIPERIVEKSIKGMLPHTSYGRELFRHLKVYAGKEHPHAAQAPEPLAFGGLTSTPDSKVLILVDPDAATLCA